MSVPLTGTPQNNCWEKFCTNLGFRALLNAVRGKRVRNPWVSREGTWDVPATLPGCPRPLGVLPPQAASGKMGTSTDL